MAARRASQERDSGDVFAGGRKAGENVSRRILISEVLTMLDRS